MKAQSVSVECVRGAERGGAWDVLVHSRKKGKDTWLPYHYDGDDLGRRAGRLAVEYTCSSALPREEA